MLGVQKVFSLPEWYLEWKAPWAPLLWGLTPQTRLQNHKRPAHKCQMHHSWWTVEDKSCHGTFNCFDTCWLKVPHMQHITLTVKDSILWWGAVVSGKSYSLSSASRFWLQSKQHTRRERRAGSQILNDNLSMINNNIASLKKAKL